MNIKPLLDADQKESHKGTVEDESFEIGIVGSEDGNSH